MRFRYLLQPPVPSILTPICATNLFLAPFTLQPFSSHSSFPLFQVPVSIILRFVFEIYHSSEVQKQEDLWRSSTQFTPSHMDLSGNFLPRKTPRSIKIPGQSLDWRKHHSATVSPYYQDYFLFSHLSPCAKLKNKSPPPTNGSNSMNAVLVVRISDYKK